MSSDSSAESEMTDRVNLVLGTIMMTIGSGMAVLIFADRSGAALDWLPGVWSDARDFHILICVMIFALAALVLKGTPPDAGPQPPRSPFRRVRLYTRENCELCVRAIETLRARAKVVGPFEIIDIDGDPELKSRFDNCVPVLEVDGKVRFRGIIRPELLVRLAAGAERQQQHGQAVGQGSPAGEHHASQTESR